MEDANPYQAPASLEGDAPAAAPRRLPVQLLVGWTAVFLFNMAVPLLYGWIVTEKHGRAGMFFAAAAIWLLGGWLCLSQRKLGLSLVVGGAPMALSQCIPILQVMAGIVALGIGELFGQVEESKRASQQIVSEPGGFLVTIITGGLLIGAALVLGLLMRALMPARWCERASLDA